MTVRIPRWLLLGAIALVVAGGAAFGVITFLGDEDGGTPTGSPVRDDEAAEDAAELAAAQALETTCQRQLGSFMSALEELDSRLNVGLSYDEYSSQVGDAQVAYDQIPFSRLENDCVGEAGFASENSFNAYVKAQNTWSECFDDFDCDIDGIDPALQVQWSKASDLLEDAKRGLRGLGEV